MEANSSSGEEWPPPPVAVSVLLPPPPWITVMLFGTVSLTVKLSLPGAEQDVDHVDVAVGDAAGEGGVAGRRRPVAGEGHGLAHAQAVDLAELGGIEPGSRRASRTAS